MWTSIATLRENLSQITLDVHDVADELLVSGSLTGGDASASSDRRTSGRFAQSISSPRFPIPNGVDFASTSEMEHCKSEIQRLKESEGKVQKLLNNYVTILKEKEAQLSKLHEENHLLKKHLEKTDVVEDLSRGETMSRSKELIDALEEKTNDFEMVQINYESKLKHLREQLETQGRVQEDLRLKLQAEHEINDSFQKELQNLRDFKEKNSLEMDILRKQLKENLSEITRLQAKWTQEELNEGNKKLESVISSLVEENGNLKKEKDKLSASLELLQKRLVEKNHANKSDADRGATSVNEVVHSSKFSEKEDTKFSLDHLERNLKEVCQERDKALQQLSRLKQHLLEKELEESEKMDEDSKIIEELRAKTEQQRFQISYLEREIKQVVSSQEQLKKAKEDELLKANEIISDLRNKLCSCMNTVDAKNVELLNLQTALGQLYAENEAKERMECDLTHTKEELIKLSDSLKVATQRLEVSKKEQEDMLSKLSESERTLLEGKYRIQKLEEDNIKLRHALEQTMTRINRMTSDSDYFVDRRIVIKLLVVYFQRNHSREVLDLMVRMLGFSDEDKQRIGLAQKVAGKGVVRGVLGLPSRLVGGIFGANSEVSSHLPSENQSFADLWVDFLLKETEEKERRENLETTGALLDKTPNSTRTWSENIQPANHTLHNTEAYSVSSREPNLEAEFSNVPLGSSVSSYNTTPFSKFLP